MSWKRFIWDPKNEDREDSDSGDQERSTRPPQPGAFVRQSVFNRTTGVSAFNPGATAPKPAVDSEFEGEIITAINNAAKQPGFNEFFNQLNVLRVSIPDSVPNAEGIRVQAAIATVKAANNISLPQIIASMRERLNLLDHEESTFMQETQTAERNEVESKSAQVLTLDAEIAGIDQQIADLHHLKSAKQRSRDVIASEVTTIGNKFAGHKSRFAGAAQACRDRLTALLGALETRSGS